MGTNQWSFPFGNNHIAQRLTNSVFTAHVQCAVQFNNGTGTYGVGGTNDLLNNLAPYWINTFFNRPDYLKVDNKPLLFIYDMPQLISDLGARLTLPQLCRRFAPDACRPDSPDFT